MNTIRLPIYLLLLTVAGHFAIDFMLSIWPVFKTMAGVDIKVAGFMATIAVAGGEMMQLFFGKLIDKGYQKPLLFVAPLLGSVAFFFPYVETPTTFFLFLLLTCLGSAAFHPTAASIVGSIQERRGLFLGLFQTAGMVGMGIGPLFFVTTHNLLDGHTAVLAAIPLLVALAVLYIPQKEHSALAVKPEHASLRLVLKLFQIPELRALYFIQLTTQAIGWSVIFLLPDFLTSRQYPEWMALGGGQAAFTLGAAASCCPMGYLGDRFSPPKVIFASCLMMIASLYAMLLAPNDMISTTLILLFCTGWSFGGLTPLALSSGSDYAPNNRGLVSAFLLGLVWVAAEAIGIGGGSFLASSFETEGPTLALMWLGSLLCVGCIFAWKLIASPQKIPEEL